MKFNHYRNTDELDDTPEGLYRFHSQAAQYYDNLCLKEVIATYNLDNLTEVPSESFYEALQSL